MYLHQKVLHWSFCTLREKCLNTEFFLVRIQSEYRKIRTRKSPVFGHFSRSEDFNFCKIQKKNNKKNKQKNWDTSTSSQVENLDAADLKIS